MKTCAIISIIYDGGKLFNIWYKYYCQYFQERDIYLLCNEKTTKESGLLDGLTCNTVNFLRPMFIHATEQERIDGLATVNALKDQLLDSYGCVIYADIDEIIFHPDGLDNIIDNLSMDFATCTGYEIVENRKIEKPFDFSNSVARQRSYWSRWGVYDKPLILRKKLEWECGYHALRGSYLHRWLSAKPGPPNKIKNLYLLHLHKLDYDLTKLMHDKHKISGQPAPLGVPDHNTWWEKANNNLELIPEKLKNKFNF